MTNLSLPVSLEAGSKRSFASALDWPGWTRGGRDEPTTLETLLAYAPRYARVAELAGTAFRLPQSAAEFAIVERLQGGAGTDFGAPEGIPAVDAQPMDEAEYQRQLSLLRACWQVLEQTAQAAEGHDLRLGPRGGGRDLGRILAHVAGAQAGYAARLLWKARIDESAPPDWQLAAAKQATLDALDAAARNGLPEKGPRGGKLWPARYFVRRSAWHILDHAWEIEDRVIAE